MPTIDQWRNTWSGLGALPPDDLYDRLLDAYSEPRRKYHTARHLDECLAAFAEVRSQAQHPDEVELAIWFHDAVYDTKRKDNEEKSAHWARSALLDAGVSETVAGRVQGLIMATRYDATPEGTDAEILVDVDFSILGAPPERFEEYDRQIREEYSWVPKFIFRHVRKKVLTFLLNRKSIFNTEHFRKTLEARARGNLRQALER